jgi:hypothetical protein
MFANVSVSSLHKRPGPQGQVSKVDANGKRVGAAGVPAGVR